MALVHMADLDFGVKRLNYPPAGDPGRYLLQDADLATGVVELASDPPIRGAVERVVGVEQVEPDASNRRLPDTELDRPSG